MKIAVCMDSPTLLKPYKDSTIAMIREAVGRGWSCVYFTPSDLLAREGAAYAQMHEMAIGSDLKHSEWIQITPVGEKPLTDFDAVLIRQDPPFNLEYVYATYALELAANAGVLVANRPSGLRDANEKFLTMHVADCAPPMVVTKAIHVLRDFWEVHRDVVFKPLDGMGGAHVFHVGPDGANLSVILETLTHYQTVTIMAQRYIPEIATMGDKRILLIDGEPIPFALARHPCASDWRGNMAAGATTETVPLTPRDKAICDRVGPLLREKGLYFVGIDVIGDYLTEINVTSPTGIVEVKQLSGFDAAVTYLDWLSARCKT